MDFIGILLSALSPLILAGLAWLGSKVGELIQSKIHGEHLRGLLLRLEDAVVTSVKDLQQTFVDEVKAASADGRISPEDRRRIRDRAIRNVKSYLGPKGMRELGEVLALWELSLDDFIGSKVEAAVHDLRRAAVRGPEVVVTEDGR